MKKWKTIMEMARTKFGYVLNQREPIRVEVTHKFDEPLAELMNRLMEKSLTLVDMSEKMLLEQLED